MADYSTNATQLAAPQAAGAGVQVTPVQSDGTLANAIKTVGNIFAKGFGDYQKAEAEKRKNAVVSNYVSVETTINDAVSTGQMSPSEAAARSRANFNKHAAGYAEYIKDFEEAGKALRGFTEAGEVADSLKREKDARDADKNQARQRGFVFPEGMSRQAEDDQIAAVKAAIRAEQVIEQQYKANVEARAQGNYDTAIADREAKDTSFRLINDIAGTNLQAFQSFAVTLGDQVKSQKMSPETALATLNERFANISAAIQSAARTNPELAAPYRSLFDQMNQVAQKLIDPKNQAEDLQNQLKIIQTRMKLVAMSNPKDAALIIANELLPNNLALQSSVQSVDLLNRLANTPIGDTTKFVPTVVGNPEAEPEVLKMLKGALNDIKSDKIDKKEIAAVQAGNSVNQILKQTSEFLNRGATPQSLKGLAQFFSSPEYGSFVSSGKIDKAAAGAAYKTFQLLYEPTVVKGVQQKFTEYLYGQASFGKKQADPITIGEAIDVKFSGSGVVFEAKPNKKLDPVEQRNQMAAVRDLTTAQTAINQLIHIGAHLEGTTDYSKYWEEKKHIFMPQIFPDPKRLKPGDIVDGYKYLGGNANDARSWQPAEGN